MVNILYLVRYAFVCSKLHLKEFNQVLVWDLHVDLIALGVGKTYNICVLTTSYLSAVNAFKPECI